MAAWHEAAHPHLGSPVWGREDCRFRVRRSMMEPGKWIVQERINGLYRYDHFLGRHPTAFDAAKACDHAHPLKKEGTCDVEKTG